MATLNKWVGIGNLGKDPEVRSFANGGKVCQFSVACNAKKKDASGQWVNHATFVDVKCFDSDKGRKLASLCEEYLRKGNLVFVEGRLELEQWEDKNGGGKRSRMVVIAFAVEFLTPKAGAGEPARQGAPAQDRGDAYDDDGSGIPY